MMTSLPLSLEMRQASCWGEVRLHAPRLLPVGWGVWKKLYIAARPREVVFFPESHFAVGDRVKSLQVIQYKKRAVPKGSLGSIVALEPKMRVKWDAFSTLDNAVVIESQIENLKDVTHRQAHSVVKCDGVESAVEDIRMVTLSNASRTVAWLRFPDLQTRQTFILLARPQVLKAAIDAAPRKKSAFVAFFNNWATPRVSAPQKALALDSIEPSDLDGATSPEPEQNECQHEDSEIGPITQPLSLACLKDCDHLSPRTYSRCSVDTTDTTNEGDERADRITVQDGCESVDSGWSRMGNSKSSNSGGVSLTGEEDESSSQRNANSSNGLIGPSFDEMSDTDEGPSFHAMSNTVGPSFYAMSDTAGPSFHAMSNTAGPSFYAMSDTAGPSFHAMSNTGVPSFYAMSDTAGPSFHALSDGYFSSASPSDSICIIYEQMAAPKHIEFEQREASFDFLDLLGDQLF